MNDDLDIVKAQLALMQKNINAMKREINALRNENKKQEYVINNNAMTIKSLQASIGKLQNASVTRRR